MKIVKVLFTLIAIGWGVLYFSSAGILLGENKIRQDNDGQDSLICRYFVGTKIIEKAYWHSSNDIMGKSICPRIIYLGENN